MEDEEIVEQVKKCKRCKLSVKKKGHWCEKHVALNHVRILINFGVQSQDKHAIPKRFEGIEYFTKAIAIGIEYLINKKR